MPEIISSLSNNIYVWVCIQRGCKNVNVWLLGSSQDGRILSKFLGSFINFCVLLRLFQRAYVNYTNKDHNKVVFTVRGKKCTSGREWISDVVDS